MKTVCAVLLACSVTAAQDFESWKAFNAKSYTSSEEEALRKGIFDANVMKINEFNALGAEYSMDVNQFADLTADEFHARYSSGYRESKNLRMQKEYSTPKAPAFGALPTAVDWRKHGAVTPVKNQGNCGSCWAFSTTGSTEGAHKLATQQLVSLSEQELVDCSQAEGNQGCNGGLMDQAFQYIITNGGICSEASYPYLGVDGTCQTTCTKVATISSFTNVTPKNDTAMELAVIQQPISIAIEADQSSFQFYSKGVLTGACGTNLDHGVLAVGFNHTIGGAEYWIVKNSWGNTWGMGGYVLLGRGPKYGPAGQCGIYSVPSYPTGSG